MTPDVISWIVAIACGSTVAKFLGLIFKKRDLGIVAGPVVGIIGGVLLWRISLLVSGADSEDLAVAGLTAAAGGLIAYLLGVALKPRI